MTGWVSGDWSAIWRFGDAVSNLGDCLQQLSINIQKGVIDLDLSWDGNASDTAALIDSSDSLRVVTTAGKDGHDRSGDGDAPIGGQVCVFLCRCLSAGLIRRWGVVGC